MTRPRVILEKISFGNTLQFQQDGSNLGDNLPSTVNFIGSLEASREDDTVNINILNQASSAAIYMFVNSNSDVSGYKRSISLNQYSSTTAGETSQTVTTTETLLEEFVTNPGYPNLRSIPSGDILVHYETRKNSGGQSFYSFARIYKRDGSTETLIATSDNSTTYSANTAVQNTVTAYVSSPVLLNNTDRIVVKIYAVMLNSSSTITTSYDGSTNARVELPVAISAFSMNNATIELTDSSTIDITNIKHTLSTSSSSRTFTISHLGDDSTVLLTLNTSSCSFTFPANTLCFSDGVASGNNVLSVSGTSGDKFLIKIKNIGGMYFVDSKNFIQ